jgi:endonuclease/exonuclease/phosphatase family metal-dependent hydrolase
MRCGIVVVGVLAALLWPGAMAALRGAEAFRVATYNLENYLEAPVGDRQAKPAAARAKVRESVLAMRPDVLAVQEIGSPNALRELQAGLKADGLDYPHWEFVAGHDTNIHLGVLSRFPIVARRPHTNENFLLRGRRFQVSRGFAEVDIEVSASYTFTLIVAHLKSRRPMPSGDEAELREQEAIRLRDKIDARLAANPNANLLVVGDLNDTKDSATLKTLIGRGKTALLDTRPAERNGHRQPSSTPGLWRRNVTWTYFYGNQDSYQRVDYILVSPGMAKEWDPAGTYVLSLPNWGAGSDHRPIVATFLAQER